MTALHVQARPFPGHVPLPSPDPTKAAASALAAARSALTGPTEHPPRCRCSVWCRDEWVYAQRGAPALGGCSVCDEPCRSIDPEGVLRHPTCEVPG